MTMLWPSGSSLYPPRCQLGHVESVSLNEIRRFHYRNCTSVSALTENSFIACGPFLRGKKPILVKDKACVFSIEGEHHRCIDIDMWVKRSAVLDSSQIVLVTADGLVLWDSDKELIVREFERTRFSWRSDIAPLSPTTFVTAGCEQNLILWDRNKCEPIRKWSAADHLPTHSLVKEFYGVAALSAKTFLSISWAYTISYWNVDQDAPVCSFSKSASHLAPINDKEFLVADGSTRYFRHCRVGNEGKLSDTARYPKGYGAVNRIAFLSSHLIAIARSRCLEIWALPKSPSEPARLLAQEGLYNLRDICVIPTDDPKVSRLVVAGNRGYIGCWEVRVD